MLIVDDDPDTLECMAALLDHEGFEVIVGRGGQEAIDLALSRQPDAIFLDVRMPHVDGLEAARTIRARSKVPVPLMAAITGGGGVPREDALSAGFTHYFLKPASIDTLVSSLSALEHELGVSRTTCFATSAQSYDD